MSEQIGKVMPGDVIMPGDVFRRNADGSITPLINLSNGVPLSPDYLPPATPRLDRLEDSSRSYRLPIGRDAETRELVYSGLRVESVSPLRIALYMTGGGIIGLLVGLAWQHFHP